MVLLGDKDLGTCSKVTAVGRMRAERRTTAKPWGPWKAQQFPGCTSGWKGRSGSGQGWVQLPRVQLWLTWGGTAAQLHRRLLRTLLCPPGAYLEDDAGRLGVVPQGDAKEAEEGRLGLIGLGTSGADHTGP